MDLSDSLCLQSIIPIFFAAQVLVSFEYPVIKTVNNYFMKMINDWCILVVKDSINQKSKIELCREEELEGERGFHRTEWVLAKRAWRGHPFIHDQHHFLPFHHPAGSFLDSFLFLCPSKMHGHLEHLSLAWIFGLKSSSRRPSGNGVEQGTWG